MKISVHCILLLTNCHRLQLLFSVLQFSSPLFTRRRSIADKSHQSRFRVLHATTSGSLQICVLTAHAFAQLFQQAARHAVHVWYHQALLQMLQPSRHLSVNVEMLTCLWPRFRVNHNAPMLLWPHLHVLILYASVRLYWQVARHALTVCLREDKPWMLLPSRQSSQPIVHLCHRKRLDPAWYQLPPPPPRTQQLHPPRTRQLPLRLPYLRPGLMDLEQKCSGQVIFKCLYS